MFRLIAPVALMVVIVGTAPSQAAFLTTAFTSNNGGSVGGAVYFDLNITNPLGITLTNLDVNTAIAVGTPLTLNVYTRPGSFTGTNSSSAGWTLVSSGTGTSAGNNLPSAIDIGDIVLAPGVTGVALHASGFGHRYTNGNGTNQVFSNTDLTFTGGAASNVLFTGAGFTPRIFNGTFTYDVNGAPEPAAVPVPATILILPAGIAMIGLIRRRRAAA